MIAWPLVIMAIVLAYLAGYIVGHHDAFAKLSHRIEHIHDQLDQLLHR